MKFLSALRNEAKDKRAWFTIAVFLGLINLYQLHMISDLSGRVNNVLIPFGLVRGHVPVKMTADVNIQNAQYLTTLALSDMSLLTTWTPSTVKFQMARFIARLSPDYQGGQETVLLHQAKRDENKAFSQTFFVNGTSVRGNSVTLSGILERWQKGAPESSASMQWTFTYQWVDGIPYISNVSEKEVKSNA
ncbi:TraE/TraK family type IV conjugative transfer system protein [Acidihalobacter aeolianus]|nr:TraE/TraK family type IV conjugative transfer system protein [Acidihalobacter aeolianus]